MYSKYTLLLVAMVTSAAYAQQCGGGEEDAGPSEPPPRHTNIVLLGATGDLAKKYLWKALFNLFSKHYVKGKTAFSIYGCARAPPDEGRSQLSNIMLDLVQCKDDSACRQLKAAFVAATQYHQLKDEKHYAALADKVTENTQTMYGLKDAEWNSEEGRLVYLSIPPAAYAKTSRLIHKYLRPKLGNPWFRIVIEKPFGNDKASAAALAEKIGKYFKDDEVYRIDHYLGKPVVKAILPFREKNAESFEELWNHRHVERVEIVMKETVDVRGRTNFYDETGVLRDVVQNHLTEILALVAMELPGKQATINQILTNKVNVLKSVAKLDVSSTVIGQYHEYPAEAQIELNRTNYDSTTSTFSASVLFINNARWQGVPFIVTSGKKLDEKASYVRMTFKNNRFCLDKTRQMCDGSKQLIFFISSNDPHKPVMIFASAALPKLNPLFGWKKADWNPENEFFGESHESSQQLIPESTLPDAYMTLIGAVFEGQRHLFTSHAMLMASWEIWNDVIIKLNQSRPRAYEGQGKDSNMLDFVVKGRTLEYVEKQELYPVYIEENPTFSNIPNNFIGQKLVSKPGEELVEKLATDIGTMALQTVADNREFHLAFSGGFSPRLLLRFMATSLPLFPWQHTHIWFVDERCVPFSSEYSNFNMVERELLQYIRIPYTNIHPMPIHLHGDLCSAEDKGDKLYEKEITTTVNNGSLDYILLGVGLDMHTASLFPRQPELESEELVAIATLPSSVHVKQKTRMTLTFKVINKARNIGVLVTGKAKHSVLTDVQACHDVTECPIKSVTSEHVTWYIDHDALFG